MINALNQILDSSVKNTGPRKREAFVSKLKTDTSSRATSKFLLLNKYSYTIATTIIIL